MTNTYFISDLHLGHKSILNFAGEFRAGTTVEEHDEILIEKINSVVRKRDHLFILGDVVWHGKGLEVLDRIKGTKHLVMGNHDTYGIREYIKYFDNIYGIRKHKGFWISHAPIHPDELRGKRNIHGHVHQNIIQDDRYFSVCVEALNGYPISLEEIIEKTGGAVCGEAPSWDA